MTIALKAVIFDMDGVLIDSEPLWQRAELDVFSTLGLALTLEDIHITQGLRVDQMVEYWYSRMPWPDYDNHTTSNAIVDAGIQRVMDEGQPMPHAIDALQACKLADMAIGLATSSPMKLVNAVLNKLSIRHFFNAIESAELLQYGKPHPEVYLNCAAKLGVSPNQCLAIEDSFNGLIAARAANMQTLVIPSTEYASQPRWAAAHHQFDSLQRLPELLQ
ncbi:MAG: hexitol phosphatase HxpB [Shewanella sp.]|nr:hexitol phosphatase HxpB [Shewanella sp.]MCF1430628.1 hexitol phosphatase HxpB [Shewanella sp.]MCF1437402.1 hexitol phosphatase HxpB [Shewanella sp.]MCF1458594.1 hexitol phosphatase HxpB [Shewanella sp.]